jgi:hypothetical protein
MAADPQVIESIKRHIKYRADYANIPYDAEDVRSLELESGYTVIALLYTKTPEYAWQGEDEPPVEIADKTPNICIYIPTAFERTYIPHQDWIINIPINAPIVSVKWSWLVFIVMPDGVILDGGHKEYPVTYEMPQVTGSAECVLATLQDILAKEERQRNLDLNRYLLRYGILGEYREDIEEAVRKAEEEADNAKR